MAQLSYTYTAYGWWTATVVINCQITYDAATNSSTVVFQESYVHYPGRKGYGSSSVDYITVSAGDNPSSSAGASFSTAGNSNPAGVYYYATPTPSVTVQHSAGPGAKTVTLSGSTTISVYPNENYSKMQNLTGSGSTSVGMTTVYSLSTSQGTGSSISVYRNASALGAPAGWLGNGSTIFTGDTLTVSFAASVGYRLTSTTVNGSPFTSGSTLTVTGAVAAASEATRLSYTLTITADANSIVTVKRGGSTLPSGSVIYYGDTLSVTAAAKSGYEVASAKINGVAFSGTKSVSVTGAVAVVVTSSALGFAYIRRNGAWTPYLIYIRVNGTWRRYRAYVRRNGAWTAH